MHANVCARVCMCCLCVCLASDVKYVVPCGVRACEWACTHHVRARVLFFYLFCAVTTAASSLPSSTRVCAAVRLRLISILRRGCSRVGDKQHGVGAVVGQVTVVTAIRTYFKIPSRTPATWQVVVCVRVRARACLVGVYAYASVPSSSSLFFLLRLVTWVLEDEKVLRYQ